MHPLLHLLATLALADHAVAFFPYKHPLNAGYGLGSYNHQSTGAIKRSSRLRSTRRKLHVKRANGFDIIIADTPSQTNSVGINLDEAGDMYFSVAKFGTSNEVYQLLIDTGATDSWVMGSSCEADACSLHTTLGPEDSTTLKVLDDPFNKTYGSGSVEGTLATDDIEIAGFELPFTFGLASNVASTFEDFAMDGLLGLGRAGSSSSQTARFLDILSEEQLISAKLYGIHLARYDDENNDGELNFGTPNTDRYDDNLTFTSVVSDSEFWEIPMEDFSIEDNSLDLGARTAIVDSGSSFVIMPPADAEKLHKLIPGSDLANDEYTIPCNTTETVNIKFSGKNFGISFADYVGPALDEGDEEICLSNFIAEKVFSDTQWVVGAVFMRNVYSVFDLDEERIGFGVKLGGVTENEADPKNGEKNDKDDSETPNADDTADSEESNVGEDEDNNDDSDDNDNDDDDDEIELDSSLQDGGDSNIEGSSSSQSSSSNIDTAPGSITTSSSSPTGLALESEENAAICTLREIDSYLAFMMAMVAAFMLLH